MSVYICQSCVKMVDLDTEDVDAEAIEKGICMDCLEKETGIAASRRG